MKDNNTNTQENNLPAGGKPLSKSRIFFGSLFIIVSIVMLFSFISYLMNWKADQSQVGGWFDKSSNIFGSVGNGLGHIFIFGGIGIAAFFVAFLCFVFGSLILKKKWFRLWKTLGNSLFFILWLPIFTAAITRDKNHVLNGNYGYQMMDYLNPIIGTAGLWLAILSSIALYFILELNLRPSIIKSKLNNINDNIKSVFPDSEDEFEADPSTSLRVTETESSGSTQDNKSKLEIQNPELELETITTPNNTSFENFKKKSSQNSDSDDFEFEFKIADAKDDWEDTSTKSGDLVEQFGLYDHKLDLPNFQMPPIDLLKDYGNEEIAINKDELEENKNKIVEVLKNFNVGIAQIKATIGPTVTLYEIIPEAGIRVSSIKRLQDDIALNLSALGIRIIAPMPGKGTIGIEVPRKNPTMVSMRSVIASQKFQNAEMDLPVVFGKTISNEIFMADLAKMPHLLMAGATGQGKSVGINAILTSLLYKKHPSELKFVMVDPKKVELSLYSKIERHYLAKLPDVEDPIITDTHKVINTLNSLCLEMDARYDLLKNAFCRNIKEYNQKFSERKLNPENGHRYLPYIVLVMDEFADLIMTAGKEIELPIARLAQLARAIGIHLVVATQRPSVNVITGMIKANFPARAAFRVISSIDSRTILDSTGADQLIGKGDMLYFNGNELLRLQCAFVDSPEVERIAEFIGEQRGYSSAFILPEYVSEDSASASKMIDPNERDTYFDEAARIVVSTQQGSTSMLQRQLKLGFNRAGRIMDQLEANGIVGGFNGAKPRDVLISDINSLEKMLEELRRN
ncbi:MAG: DNA translocase FtsK [Flavobacteriaceae bacterium]|jgi:S-DNA-T family DNA segregation ATPase FtsK/SpoIIIE|nr:DNA translocase FtsK [Flavobacteriaceae bacterium]